MDQLIPSLATLVESFRDCFHPQVFPTFQAWLAGWITGLGPRTLSEVWQATGWAAQRHHDTADAVVRSAAWEGDDLGIVLATRILTHLIPGGGVGIVVDDTLGHNRGATVAFGGIVLDAVLSTQRHQTLRCGVHGVVLGIAVPIPLRPDRYDCLSVLWRADRQKGQAGSQSRPHAAAARARLWAEAAPDRVFGRVGDAADVNAATRQGRPQNLPVLGPRHGKAALDRRPEPPREGPKGRPRQKGERWPAPKAMIADVASSPAEVPTVVVPQATRELRLPVIRDLLWYRGCQTDPVVVLRGRDPLGPWREEAWVATDPTVSAEFILPGDCRRWSGELGFFDSQPYLGLHDPRVGSERSVERAHPRAGFVGTLTILWYAIDGPAGDHLHRDRNWYPHKVTPTFTDRWGALRLQMWPYEVVGPSGTEAPSPEVIETLLHKMAAVA